MATRIADGEAKTGRKWRLTAAGRFAIVDVATGHEAALRTRKARAILAYLATQAGQRFTRDRIGAMHPCFLVGHAATQAVAGNHEKAIRLLQQTGANSTCFNIVHNGRVDPLFENLRGDPGFERIVRRYVAHVQQERREVLAMQLF